MTVAVDPPRRPSPERGEAVDSATLRWHSFARHLGPGLVSGTSDNDPSGIVTYTQIGAQLGYAACWIMPLCYPDDRQPGDQRAHRPRRRWQRDFRDRPSLFELDRAVHRCAGGVRQRDQRRDERVTQQ